MTFVRFCTSARLRPCGLKTSSRAFHQSARRFDAAVRLRFAPSPTGSLHLGGLRTALFNHLLARKLGGKWILRIEDTDRTRFVPGAGDELLKCLTWAGLDYDEGPGKGGEFGPYIQSERRHIYDGHLKKLLEAHQAYRCFCSSERLNALRLEARRTKSPTHYDGYCRHLPQNEVDQKLANNEPFVVRFRSKDLPEDQDDLVYGQIRLAKLPQEDFILIKSDGMPTYHFANVVDDHEMHISHILRGEEWIPSTPRHMALYKAFDWTAPQYAHMPILVNADGTKLSKRSGDVKVLDYINNGWEPEALVNFVGLMGASWRNALDSDGAKLGEVLTMEQLIDNFSLDNVGKHRSTMFAGKLAYLNKAHIDIKGKTAEGKQNLIRKARRAVAKEFGDSVGKRISDEYAEAVLDLNKDRIDVVQDLPLVCPYFFVKPDYNTKEALDMRAKLRHKEVDVEATLDKAIGAFERLAADDFNEKAMVDVFAELSQSEGLHGAALMTPLRYALTGSKGGPGVAAIMSLLGQEESLARLTFVRNVETRPA